MTTDEHIRALREALAKNPTTGPWFDSRSERFPECYVRAANGQHIAAVPWSTENDGANSALIAAAHPEAIRAVLAALDEARRDAERYRWLRDKSVPPHNFYLSVPIEFDGVKYSPAEVDAAIDAALTPGA